MVRKTGWLSPEYWSKPPPANATRKSGVDRQLEKDYLLSISMQEQHIIGRLPAYVGEQEKGSNIS
jgi:hypothetical protein